MGFNQFLLVVLLVQCVLSAENTRKIDLEDIERDNLVSENQAENGKEHLEKQQTQYFRPPGIQAYNQFKTSSIAAALRGGVQYAGTRSRQEDELDKEQNDFTHRAEEDRGQRLSQVHYVPSSNAIQEHNDYAAPAFHETARANIDPIRPTLLKPVGSPLEQRPSSEYLFLPERNSPQVVEPRELKHVEGAIQYAEPQHVAQAFDYKQEQETEDEHQSPQHDEYLQQEQHPGAVSYMQYMPFIARGPSAEQTYVMMAPVPAGYHQASKQVHIVPSVVAYSHSQSPAVVPAIQYQPQPMQYIGPVVHQQPQINYIDNNEAEGHSPPRRSNDQDIQYASPNDISGYNSLEKSKQYVFAPKHPEYEKPFPRVQQLPNDNYAVSPVHHPVYSLPRAVQAIQIPPVQANLPNFQPIYPAHHHPDLFHGRDTKSLLDSYIPSWIVVQRQKSLQQNYPTPVVNGYNTISYSVPNHLPRNEGGYYDKRSLKSPM